MGSPLDFIPSEEFRKKLMVRNLKPYKKAPVSISPPVNYEYRQSDHSVKDSDDNLIDEPTLANKLYPLNQYGKIGGYEQVPDVNTLKNTKSNEGEYGFEDSDKLDQAEALSKLWKKGNAYGDGTDTITDSADFFMSFDKISGDEDLYTNQPYPLFVMSSYNPLSILLSDDPQGSSGRLSEDSYIAKIGAQSLKAGFEERIAEQIKQETIYRANILNIRDVNDIIDIISGKVPVFEPNWKITIPQNPVVAAADLALRLGGSTIPLSPIPGSYFDTAANNRNSSPVRRNPNGGFFNKVSTSTESGSQIFYNNTGGGQKSLLFFNIDYNKYRPNFERTLFNRLAGQVVGDSTESGNFYVGSSNSNPSTINSPIGEIPVDEFGSPILSPVYGPSEIAQIYEGNSREIKLGANGPTYSDGGGIEGGMTWVSPTYKGNAGKRVGPGGVIVREDEDYRPYSYEATESTNLVYKTGSILDDTQRIIDSQPKGGKRLQHAGNAIDQVSKVFHDGYRELTKGSKVLSYVGDIGQEVGVEYCRVFTKDIPYLQFNDLQKTDGIVTENRRFSYSVLDKTYNLNIVPNKLQGGSSSSNLIGGPDVGYAKKYMFSLENLAWRTSNTPGLTYSDLPLCERGPNGGRVMWFPPYGLEFSENITANWKSQDFLGRPEPVYTYNNTRRGGTLKWKIVVDHPSVLNVIVNKVLNNETNKSRVDSILNSFFAGCRKYDLYELAQKYSTVNPNDLKYLQQVITNKEVTTEQMEYIKKTIQNGQDNAETQSITYTAVENPFQDDYREIAMYFGNDYPKSDNVVNYEEEFNRYTSDFNINWYREKSPSTADETTSFFENVVVPNFDKIKELTNDIDAQLTKYPEGTITLWINSSCSAPASQSYNVDLGNRRIQSAKLFFEQNEKTKKWIDNQRLFIREEPTLGEAAQVKFYNTQTSSFELGKYVNCSDENSAGGGDVTVQAKEKYTTNAMACRRAFISKITSTLQEPVSTPPAEVTEVIEGTVVTNTVSTPVVETVAIDRKNITKFVVRNLISECDYFETMKQDAPIAFDSLKEKLKFFHPGFHSMTPEGLNGRLTFLQQCLRPGDTIPTVKQIDGGKTLQYNNAVNTAFGAPPVLILRVGDFFHTKIIPNSISISYENLDLNPEGIGVQPMIADITLSFDFIGGHGLKESVDKLQNALTFNYYANTEIWDDRAEVTDNSLEVLDKDFLTKPADSPPPTVNQTQPTNGQNNGQTIGVITSKTIGQYETGEINYSDFMVSVKDETEKYFKTIFEKIKETNSQYNNAIRQQISFARNYTRGDFYTYDNDGDAVRLFGKPFGFETRIASILDDYISDINNNNDEFIKYISMEEKNFSSKLIRQIKSNYKTYIENKSLSFTNSVSKITQDIALMQQNYIQIIGRLNTVVYNGDGDIEGINIGTDGFQQKNGKVVIYNVSATTEVDISSGDVANTYIELENDSTKIAEDLNAYIQTINQETSFTFSQDKTDYVGIFVYPVENNGQQIGEGKITDEQVFIPFNKDTVNLTSNITVSLNDDGYNLRRMYLFLSNDIVDSVKYQTFKTQLIGNVIGNQGLIGNGRDNIEEVFDDFWGKKIKGLFDKENKITAEFIDYIEKNTLSSYIKYMPFDKKKRTFTFTSDPTGNEEERIKSQELLIKGFNLPRNLTTDVGRWNDIPSGASLDTYVSKIKLN